MKFLLLHEIHITNVKIQNGGNNGKSHFKPLRNRLQETTKCDKISQNGIRKEQKL